jgi:peptidoglycan/LPS O-acetylase OafA/YrhL
VLTYLGTISYSLYIVHPLLIYTVPADLSHWQAVVVQIGGTVAVSAITYRFIEKPAITAGRRLARAWRSDQPRTQTLRPGFSGSTPADR